MLLVLGSRRLMSSRLQCLLCVVLTVLVLAVVRCM